LEALREVLRGSLGRSLRGLSQADRLAAAWTVACGPALAGYGTVAGYEAGILQVRVQDAIWMAQMRSIRAVLAGQIARSSGVSIDDIQFSLQDRSTAR
jgi:hypothetical protein